MTRIGINGFGRIGTAVARILMERGDLDIAVINDPAPMDMLTHLFAHDSVRGPVHGVSASDGALMIGETRIPFFGEREPEAVPWGDHGCDVVFECSGFFRDRTGAERFFQSGAPYLVISAPAKDPDFTVVLGVNDSELDLEKHRIISNASCTTNCLAPVAKVLHDQVGVVRGTMTTIHAYTNDQRLLDAAHKQDFRRARAAAVNIVPTTTGAAKAVGLVLPALEGKLDGLAMRVPVPNVSLVDLSVVVERPTSAEEINAFFVEAAQREPLAGVLATSAIPLVSSDYMNNPASSTVDLALTTVMEGTLVKVISWYDNEWGFSNRMVDLAARFPSR
jgi:glyceraldehyde 3-phosphate dehydrogenase